MSTKDSIRRLERAGFGDWSTGGGCMAWGLEIPITGSRFADGKPHQVQTLTIMLTDANLGLDLRFAPYAVSYELDSGADHRGGTRSFQFLKLSDAVNFAISISKPNDVYEE